jgi:hypothetical protein
MPELQEVVGGGSADGELRLGGGADCGLGCGGCGHSFILRGGWFGLEAFGVLEGPLGGLLCWDDVRTEVLAYLRQGECKCKRGSFGFTPVGRFARDDIVVLIWEGDA